MSQYQTPDADVAWMGTEPVPAGPYYDQEFYELERKAVFMRSWINVGQRS